VVGRIFLFGGQERMGMISARMCGDGEEFISTCSSVVREMAFVIHTLSKML